MNALGVLGRFANKYGRIVKVLNVSGRVPEIALRIEHLHEMVAKLTKEVNTLAAHLPKMAHDAKAVSKQAHQASHAAHAAAQAVKAGGKLKPPKLSGHATADAKAMRDYMLKRLKQIDEDGAYLKSVDLAKKRGHAYEKMRSAEAKYGRAYAAAHNPAALNHKGAELDMSRALHEYAEAMVALD